MSNTAQVSSSGDDLPAAYVGQSVQSTETRGHHGFDVAPLVLKARVKSVIAHTNRGRHVLW